MDLLNDTISRLERTEIPYAVLASELGVSIRWLYKLRAGKFKDPGVNKISKLHRILISEATKVA